jgi:hypothetical protein
MLPYIFRLCKKRDLRLATQPVRMPMWPISMEELFVSPKWDKVLSDKIIATQVGLLKPRKSDFEDT